MEGARCPTPPQVVTHCVVDRSWLGSWGRASSDQGIRGVGPEQSQFGVTEFRLCVVIAGTLEREVACVTCPCLAGDQRTVQAS